MDTLDCGALPTAKTSLPSTKTSINYFLTEYTWSLFSFLTNQVLHLFYLLNLAMLFSWFHVHLIVRYAFGNSKQMAGM